MTTPDVHDDASAVDDAEHGILSALLTGGTSTVEAVLSTGLRPADFQSEACARAYAAALEVHRLGRSVDPITLATQLEMAGWPHGNIRQYLGELLDRVPTPANAASHAEIVIDAARRHCFAAHLERSASDLRAGRVRVRDIATAMDRVAGLLLPASDDRIRLWTARELAERQSPTALIDGVAFVNSLVLVVGRYSTMKTFLMLDMAMSIAAGVEWQGRRIKRGPVVYIYAEGPRGIPSRIEAWRAAAGCGEEGEIRFVPTSVMMDDKREVRTLINKIRAAGIQPVAVFVDTLARNMTGDEQKTLDMGAFVAGCDSVREAFEATVVVAHHMGWSAERSRGSSSLPGAVDTELVVHRRGLVLTVECRKQKDGPEFSPITLKAFESAGSLALRRVGQPTSALTRNERKALSVVQRPEGMTSTVWRKASGLAKGSHDNARKRLVGLGYVTREGRTYLATEAGRQALGTTLNTGTNDGQTVAPSQGQPRLTPTGVSVVPDGLRAQPARAALERSNS